MNVSLVLLVILLCFEKLRTFPTRNLRSRFLTSLNFRILTAGMFYVLCKSLLAPKRLVALWASENLQWNKNNDKTCASGCDRRISVLSARQSKSACPKQRVRELLAHRFESGCLKRREDVRLARHSGPVCPKLKLKRH